MTKCCHKIVRESGPSSRHWGPWRACSASLQWGSEAVPPAGSRGKQSATACVECISIYADASDPKKDEDWLSCPTCNTWVHGSCFYATAIWLL